MPFRLSAFVVATLVATLVACSREPRGANGTAASAVSTTAWTLNVQPMPEATKPGTTLPRLTASERAVILSWVERAGPMARLRFAERTASGWSEPTDVAGGGNWFLSYADPPTVLRRPDGTLVANWLVSTNPAYEGSDLYVSYSTDNGKVWARPFTPHHDGTEQQHAFPSFFELPGNALGVIWLDGRDVQPTDANPVGGGMALRYAAYDAQWQRTTEGVVDAMACDCCSTTAAITSDGVLTAFRDRSDKEIRDIAVSRFQNGKWTEPVRVHDDNWEIFGCPVNGPALSARGDDAVVAWFTAKEDKGQAWVAFSNDAGRTWGQPIRLDDAASLGRVGVELLDDGAAVASWVEYADKRGQFKVRRVDRSGARSNAIDVASPSARLAMDVPRMTRRGKELVFAWTEISGPDESDAAFQVRTAVAVAPD